MNLGSFAQAKNRLKLGVLLCVVVTGFSLTGLAQSDNGNNGASSSAINNPANNNVSTGNYIPPPPPSGPNVYYNHRWDLYAGMTYTNFLAGPRLIQRSNLGGWEAGADYWLNWHWGLVGDARQYIGTSGVFPNTQGGIPGNPCKPYSQSCYNHPTITGPRIMQYYFMAGPAYRFLRHTKYSMTAHATFGQAYGIFDAALPHGLDPQSIGLFATQWTFAGAVGGTYDYNWTPRIAFRAQPELLLTRYGGTAQQNFGFSAGLLFRMGHLDTAPHEEPMQTAKKRHFYNRF